MESIVRMDSEGTSGEGIELARIFVRSMNQPLQQIARDIVSILEQGDIQMIDMKTISADQSEILVLGFKGQSEKP
jgi:hypothetical protein